jgi:hypothetical protein
LILIAALKKEKRKKNLMAKQMTPSEEEELKEMEGLFPKNDEACVTRMMSDSSMPKEMAELFPGEKQGHIRATTLMATPSSMAKPNKKDEQKSSKKNEELLELEKEIDSNMTDINELAKQIEKEMGGAQIMRMASMTSMPAKDQKKKKKLFGKK